MKTPAAAPPVECPPPSAASPGRGPQPLLRCRVLVPVQGCLGEIRQRIGDPRSILQLAAQLQAAPGEPVRLVPFLPPQSQLSQIAETRRPATYIMAAIIDPLSLD